MENNTEIRWTATPTTKRVRIEGLGGPGVRVLVRGTGVVLFGNRIKPTAKGSRWFERRFETFAKALAYAAKQGIEVDVKLLAEVPSEAELRAQIAAEFPTK